MKLPIIGLLLLTFSSVAFGIGGEGGGGGAGGNGGVGGGPKIAKRSIASVETEDNFGKKCLLSLESGLAKIKDNVQGIKNKNLIKEILTLTDEIKKSKIKLSPEDRVLLKNSTGDVSSNTISSVDSLNFPECFAYAQDVKNDKMKSMLVKNKLKANLDSESEDLKESGKSKSK